MPVWNFSAGPARLPDSVLIRARSELTNWHNCGMSVMEMSHRSPEFESIIKKTETDLRTLMKIPDNYKVLFMQGGATTQFSAIPLNLLNTSFWNAPVDYAVTGTWSEKAVDEAKRYAKTVNTVYSGKDKKYTTVAPQSAWTLSPNAAYLYYCANETVNGVEFPSVPEVSVPLVCDMSSNLLSRPVEVEKYGLIYGSCQKNCGIAGVTIVIIREDLLGHSLPCCPQLMDYQTHAKAGSLYNTPPCFAIYMLGLVLEWIISDVGGLEAMQERNIAKAEKVYGLCDRSRGFYTAVVDPVYRSRMNVPFRIKGGNDALEKEFLAGAKKAGLLELKGHRSVGGLRASLYNAMPMEGIDALCTYMEDFMAQHTKAAAKVMPPLSPKVALPAYAAGQAKKAATAAAGGGDLSKFRVLVLDKCDKSAVSLFANQGISADEKAGLKEDELCKIIGDYDAMVVRSATTVTPKVIEAATKLKIIGRAGVGVDNINLPAATKNGVIVVNSPQGNTTSAAEHTWGMIMATARQIPQAGAKLANGVWDRKSFMGVEMEGRTLGILGFGNIGKRVAKYGLAFGMKVMAYDPFVSSEQGAKLGVTMGNVDEVLAQSDVITLHLPAIKETHKLINARTIATMKKGVILVNVARGEIVDENDVAEALKSGHIFRAALDVFAPEPLSKDSPLIGLPNCVLTPHLGASTTEAQVKVAVDVCEQIIDVFKGGAARSAVNIPTMKSHLIEPVKHMLGIAEKLGKLIIQLAGEGVKAISLEVGGIEAHDLSPVTTCFLKGFLEICLAETSVNFVNAPNIAKERGLVIETTKVPAKKYVNSITATASLSSGTKLQLVGSNFEHMGATGDRIMEVNGVPVEANPVGWVLWINHPDSPGFIGKVGSWLGDHNINISFMEVGRVVKGGKATMIAAVDTTVSEKTLADFKAMVPEITSASLTYIPA